MKLNFRMTKKNAGVLLCALLLGAAFVLPSSAFFGNNEEPHNGEWVQTPLAGEFDSSCTGGKCHEWCNYSYSGLVPTGKLCCIQGGNCDPATIFYQ